MDLTSRWKSTAEILYHDTSIADHNCESVAKPGIGFCAKMTSRSDWPLDYVPWIFEGIHVKRYEWSNKSLELSRLFFKIFTNNCGLVPWRIVICSRLRLRCISSHNIVHTIRQICLNLWHEQSCFRNRPAAHLICA